VRSALEQRPQFREAGINADDAWNLEYSSFSPDNRMRKVLTSSMTGALTEQLAGDFSSIAESGSVFSGG